MARKTANPATDIAPETTANQETPVSQPATTTEATAALPTLTPEQQAFYDSLTPEQKAIFAVKAKKDAPDAVKVVGKLSRKETRLERRANKKAEKCDPNSPKYNPDYARRVAIREANEKARVAGGVTGVRTNAAKVDVVKSWLEKTTLSEEQKAAVLAKVSKVSLRAMIGADGVSTTGYRGTVKVKQAEGDDLVLRKTLTLATSKDMSLDQMKAEAETYIIHSLQKVAA